MPPHSPGAAHLVELLRGAPGGICVACAGTALHNEKLHVMSFVRELIGSGEVLCGFRLCARCDHVDLVVRLRAHSGGG
jgi:hypothetical protein